LASVRFEDRVRQDDSPSWESLQRWISISRREDRCGCLNGFHEVHSVRRTAPLVQYKKPAHQSDGSNDAEGE
jgi:hypothetical protein